jgi:hypothetical protein
MDDDILSFPEPFLQPLAGIPRRFESDGLRLGKVSKKMFQPISGVRANIKKKTRIFRRKKS